MLFIGLFLLYGVPVIAVVLCAMYLRRRHMVKKARDIAAAKQADEDYRSFQLLQQSRAASNRAYAGTMPTTTAYRATATPDTLARRSESSSDWIAPAVMGYALGGGFSSHSSDSSPSFSGGGGSSGGGGASSSWGDSSSSSSCSSDSSSSSSSSDSSSSCSSGSE